MSVSTSVAVAPPPPPRPRLALAVTGHREGNLAFDANRGAITTALSSIFQAIDEAVGAAPPIAGAAPPAPPRLHCMLVDGVDQIAADQALARGWELVAPLPFGRKLNTAVNARPLNLDEAQRLLAGRDVGPATRARAQRISQLADQARVFALAEQDEVMAALYLARLAAPADETKAQAYSFAASARVALAAQVMIEQSDLLIGVWDGASASLIGGTGHTIAMALDLGAPVVWIDARAPENWRILHAPESLAAPPPIADPPVRQAALQKLVWSILRPSAGQRFGAHGVASDGLQALQAERWRPRSSRAWHAYRRVEALFGADALRHGVRDLTQVYESPDAIVAEGGSAAAQFAAASGLPGQDAAFLGRIQADVVRRFAWADGISARLSDLYRGGMILSFVFSALAVVGGVAYLPFASSHEKWMFAVFELGLLTAILGITFVGQRRRWHGRWFETRRVAEYFRHAPILLLLGVSRPTGRWPQGAETSWPEWYARQVLRDVGLPALSVTPAYLRGALRALLADHVTRQRDYHRQKARRLALTHHRLDRLSEGLFALAVLSVTAYLALKGAGQLGLVAPEVAAGLSRLFTFLGVLLPTFGAGIAGIRYFGDFERFSAISEVAAHRLDAVSGRIELLLTAEDTALDYARVADLAHAADGIVVSEIESWQAVFGGKHITVPV